MLWAYRRLYLGVPVTAGSAKEFLLDWRRTVIIICFLLYQTVAKAVFTIFDKYDKEIDGKYYLVADLSVRADDGAYGAATFVGVLGLIVYVIGIPTSGALIVYGNRDALGDIDFLRQYGFIYDGFKLDSSYLWELVIIMRKCVIGAIVGKHRPQAP